MRQEFANVLRKATSARQWAFKNYLLSPEVTVLRANIRPKLSRVTMKMFTSGGVVNPNLRNWTVGLLPPTV